MEKREATKVFRFLIGMADADMEDAYDAYMKGVVRRPHVIRGPEARALLSEN